MPTATIIAIDRSGRLVIPKEIREAMGIGPETPLRIRVHDGRIEIEPVYAEIRRVERDGLRVAELAAPREPLPEREVRRVRRRLRERRR